MGTRNYNIIRTKKNKKGKRLIDKMIMPSFTANVWIVLILALSILGVWGIVTWRANEACMYSTCWYSEMAFWSLPIMILIAIGFGLYGLFGMMKRQWMINSFNEHFHVNDLAKHYDQVVEVNKRIGESMATMGASVYSPSMSITNTSTNVKAIKGEDLPEDTDLDDIDIAAMLDQLNK